MQIDDRSMRRGRLPMHPLSMIEIGGDQSQWFCRIPSFHNFNFSA